MRATLGDAVSAGDVLAVVSRSRRREGALRGACGIGAERNRVREDDLVARGVSTERDGLEAAARLAEARAGAALPGDLRRLASRTGRSTRLRGRETRRPASA
jgi:hypothetical protein